MGIFLLWLGLLICCVANGVIYDYVQAPEYLYYMGVVGVVDIIILIIHRIYTRNWRPTGRFMHRRSPVFMMSAIASLSITGVSLVAIHVEQATWGFFFAVLTGLFSFGMAAFKEKSYI